MEKLKISFALQSPLITNGGYMTLDGLLAALIFEQGGDLEKAHADIPLKNTNGLWHGSAAFIEKIDTEKKGFVANLHAGHDLDLDLVLKNKNGNVHKAKCLRHACLYPASRPLERTVIMQGWSIMAATIAQFWVTSYRQCEQSCTGAIRL